MAGAETFRARYRCLVLSAPVLSRLIRPVRLCLRRQAAAEN